MKTSQFSRLRRDGFTFTAAAVCYPSDQNPASICEDKSIHSERLMAQHSWTRSVTFRV